MVLKVESIVIGAMTYTLVEEQMRRMADERPAIVYFHKHYCCSISLCNIEITGFVLLQPKPLPYALDEEGLKYIV